MKLEDEILEIISEDLNINIDNIDEDTSFIDDLELDSKGVNKILISIEEYDLEINKSYIEEMETIGDLIEYIKNH